MVNNLWNQFNEVSIVLETNLCFLSLIAKLQDSGKFMVKATNSGGEAQSIADFMVLENQPDRMVEITKTTVFSDISPEQIRKVGVLFFTILTLFL